MKAGDVRKLLSKSDAAALIERMERSRKAYEAQKKMNPEFTCHVCMDDGMIEFSTGIVPCYNCEKGKEIERDNERAAWIERVNKKVGVPGTIQADARAELYDHRIVQRLRDCIESDRGSYLYGPVGRGKSVAAAAALLEFVRGVRDVGFSPRYYGVFITSSGYLQGIRDSYQSMDNVNGWRAGEVNPSDSGLSRVHTTRCLVFDDIGREYIKSNGGDSWAAEQLGELVDSRTSSGRTTIFTSNLTLDQLGKKYNQAAYPMGDRIVSRIKGSCEIINVTGPDWRQYDH